MKSKRMHIIILTIPLIFVIILLLYFFFIPWSNEVGSSFRAQIIVNGKNLEDCNATIYQRGSVYFANLPLSAVLEGLGYPVTWVEAEKAQIEVVDEVYFLVGHTLYDKDGKTTRQIDGMTASFLEEKGPPGDLFLETKELEIVLSKLGISPIQILIDPKGKSVSITYELGN